MGSNFIKLELYVCIYIERDHTGKPPCDEILNRADRDTGAHKHRNWVREPTVVPCLNSQ